MQNDPRPLEVVCPSISNYDARAIVVNDFHIPHQDKTALAIFEAILTDLIAVDKGNSLELFINGDLLDCYDISRFPKFPTARFSLKHEVDIAYALLTDWREMMGKRKITYITGNHEFRLRKYFFEFAPEIYDYLPTLEGILGLPKLKIKWIDLPEHLGNYKDIYTEWNGVLIGHFNKVSMHSAYTAKALVEKTGMSLVQGHVHRAGMHCKRIYGRQIWGLENGCMCDLEATHEVHPNWQNSLTILTLVNNIVYPELVLIDEDGAWYNNKRYTKEGGNSGNQVQGATCR